MDPVDEFTGINYNAVNRLSREEQRRGHIGFTNVNNVKEFNVTNKPVSVRNTGVTRRNSITKNKPFLHVIKRPSQERRMAMNKLNRNSAPRRMFNTLKTWSGSSWNTGKNVMAKLSKTGHMLPRPHINIIRPIRRTILSRIERNPNSVPNASNLTLMNANAAHVRGKEHAENMRVRGNKKSAKVRPWRGGKTRGSTKPKRKTRKIK